MFTAGSFIATGFLAGIFLLGKRLGFWGAIITGFIAAFSDFSWTPTVVLAIIWLVSSFILGLLRPLLIQAKREAYRF